MDENKENIIDVEDISISKEMETSFIDYAMSVIVSRAIPDARDGLKPVHRRILYAMYGLEMVHSKPFKKSARAVGEVIAKYHPHGDTAVYDSLVRMAQPFSLRYPLVWGQGNFGSIDGDGAAAMRYTEAKLQKISSLMLEDIKKDTVDFQENYDGSELEPKVLPGKLPQLLLNGTTGIAVGMATSIPPHNIIEVLNAAKALLINPDTEWIELFKHISAPDFPTGGIIINKDEIYQAYKTGRGRAIIRGKTEIESNEEKNYSKIIITEIPYMVNKANLVLKIADLVKNKTINSISDIKDESNRKGIRIVIKLKRGFAPEVELNKLFKLTPLQNNFSFNMLALVNNRPLTLNLRDALTTYNDHQISVLLRKTKFDLKKAKSRAHILEGLKIALDNIDRVVNIIRNSGENQIAMSGLIKEFNLTEKQSKAILEMRLGRLVGLERKNLDEEILKLFNLIEDYNLVIDSKDEQINRLIKMFDEIKSVYGDDRRTKVSNEIYNLINDEDMIPKEIVVVTKSKKGYIKRIPVDEYRVQNRGGIGSRGAKTSEDDYIDDIIVTQTHTDLLFFTSLGKVYRLRALRIPSHGKNAKGLPIINLINLNKDENEEVKSVISIDDYKDKDLIFVTKNGIVKKTNVKEFEKISKSGKRAISLRENDSLIGVNQISSNKNIEIILGNSNGKAIRFNLDKIRRISRIGSGVKGMNIDNGEIVGFSTTIKGNLVLSLSNKGFGKLTEIDNYRLINRGGKGVITINKKAGELVALTIVNGNDDLIVITNKGTTIRMEISQISQISRNTKGVKIVKLKEDEWISSISIVKSDDSIETEISEKTQKLEIKENDPSIDISH